MTLHSVPEEMRRTIEELSASENRSVDREVLLLLGKGLHSHLARLTEEGDIAAEVQVRLWEKLGGAWQDDRSTEEIISDIYESRSRGRGVG
jgi:hypothetical protein